jgi:hypothetical protein
VPGSQTLLVRVLPWLYVLGADEAAEGMYDGKRPQGAFPRLEADYYQCPSTTPKKLPMVFIMSYPSLPLLSL